MIEEMVTKLVSCMEKEEFIKKEEREFYVYAFIVLLERILVIGTLFVIGLARRQLPETIIFLFFFFALRKRTGGYHARQFWQCYVLSVLVYLISMKEIFFLAEHMRFFYGMLMVSLIVIEAIGTVNHPNMDMNAGELKESKKLARIIAIIETFVIIWMSALHIDKIYTACMGCAVIVCAISLGVSKIIGQEVEREDAETS